MTSTKIKIESGEEMVENELCSSLDRYLCPCCGNLLDSSFQLSCCGTRICHRCQQDKSNQPFRCSFCSEENCQFHPDKAFSRELKSVEIVCPRCSSPRWTGSFEQFQIHLQTHCDLKCQFCEQIFSLFQQRNIHEKDLCENRLISCPFSSIGCSSQFCFAKIGEHFESVEHQLRLTRWINEYFLPNSPSNCKREKKKVYCEQLENLLEELFVPLEKNESLHQLSNELRLQSQSIESQFNQINSQLEQSKTLEEKNGEILKKISDKFKEMKKFSVELQSMERISRQLLDKNDSFTWKMPFSRLDKGEKVQSERFQSSSNGYEMILKAMIQRRTKNKDNSLSIQLTFLPGEFDSILLWPFPYSFSVEILHLNDSSKSILQRISPRNEINPDSEEHFSFPLHSLLQHRNDFIQEDFLFLRLCFHFHSAN